MSCFNCFSPKKKSPPTPSGPGGNDDGAWPSKTAAPADSGEGTAPGLSRLDDSGGTRNFEFGELEAATKNFHSTNLIGVGGFGKVFKGYLEAGWPVAVKRLNQEGRQGDKEFIVETLMLSTLKHPNLVKLYGYCAEGNERLLVYEYMTKGNLESHLFDLRPGREPLGWNTRVKIATDATKGLAYLHHVDPPVIHRDMKSANILLDDEFNAKLSDFGMAKFGPVGDESHVSTRVIGTYGYCAPEYAMTGKLTFKSDVYGFGVILPELITGRKTYDPSASGEKTIVAWSRPFRSNARRYTELADPLLQGRYPRREFRYLAHVASWCLMEDAKARPDMQDVLVALYYVAARPYVDPSGGGEVQGSAFTSRPS